jgi:hypothetical protein
MILNEDNFLVHAMNHYDNPQCQTIEEFEEDLQRFLYIKKLFSRYKNSGELRERLVLNHIIVLYNLFGEELTNMLFFKIEEEYWPQLATFLVYLERMPEFVDQIGKKISDIELDNNIVSALRKI